MKTALAAMRHDLHSSGPRFLSPAAATAKRKTNMAKEQSTRGGRGLTVRQLTFIFFGLVGVCALFFALGYLAGSNSHSAGPVPVVEQTPAEGAPPPPVNAPLEDASSAAGSANARQATVIEQNLKPEAPARPEPRQNKSAADAAAKESAAPPAPAADKNRAESSETSSSGRDIMVQVAALRTGSDAESLLHTLKTHGYPAVVLHGAAGRDGLYRVQVGPFTTRDEALRALHRLSRQGFKPFIRQ